MKLVAFFVIISMIQVQAFSAFRLPVLGHFLMTKEYPSPTFENGKSQSAIRNGNEPEKAKEIEGNTKGKRGL